MQQSKNNRIFLTKAQIKGFKSIVDLKVDFERGLNILIGKNASGKSNFLEALFFAMRSSFRLRFSVKYAKIEMVTDEDDTFLWETEREIQDVHNVEDYKNRTRSKEKIYLNHDKLFDSGSNGEPKYIEYRRKKIPNAGPAVNIFHRLGFFVSPSYIRFNLPSGLICISSPGTFKISDSGDMNGLQEIDTLNFIDELFLDLELFFAENPKKTVGINKTSFLKRLKLNEKIKENLKKYTPIKDIKFNDNITIYKSDNEIVIENLKLDFKIINNWVPWSQLSDGTKRLFCLIAEVTYHQGAFIFVEEPELGVHPHQFNLIMEFLKEESINKQIIISTHSPQALNHLDENELSSILITKFDQKKGTKINHLTTSQKTKAKKYMKEVGFLSDYWMLSDLE